MVALAIANAAEEDSDRNVIITQVKGDNKL